MQINLRHIPPEGKKYVGEEDASAIHLDSELYTLKQPIRYDLEATLSGHGVLVRGRLEGTASAKCVRTLEVFDLPFNIEDFTVLVEEVAGDIVDLTPQIREDILLALPAHPVSPKAPPAAVTSHDDPVAQGSPAWETLEKLKGKLGPK